MTQEFAEIVNRLAKARNFKEGSYLLITSEPENNEFVSEFKGKHAPLISGIGGCLERILLCCNNEEAENVIEFIREKMDADEKRRSEIQTLT